MVFVLFEQLSATLAQSSGTLVLVDGMRAVVLRINPDFPDGPVLRVHVHSLDGRSYRVVRGLLEAMGVRGGYRVFPCGVSTSPGAND